MSGFIRPSRLLTSYAAVAVPATTVASTQQVGPQHQGDGSGQRRRRHATRHGLRRSCPPCGQTARGHTLAAAVAPASGSVRASVTAADVASPCRVAPHAPCRDKRQQPDDVGAVRVLPSARPSASIPPPCPPTSPRHHQPGHRAGSPAGPASRWRSSSPAGRHGISASSCRTGRKRPRRRRCGPPMPARSPT